MTTAGCDRRLGGPRAHPASASNKRSRWAVAAASPRLPTPNLAKMLETCTLTVFALTNSASAICLLNFWIPVHVAITIFVILSLILTWKEAKVRYLLLVGLGSYIVMRGWSGLYFHPGDA